MHYLGTVGNIGAASGGVLSNSQGFARVWTVTHVYFRKPHPHHGTLTPRSKSIERLQ